MDKTKVKRIPLFAVMALLILLTMVMVAGFILYLTPLNSISLSLFRVTNLPIAKVDSEWVTLDELEQSTQSKIDTQATLLSQQTLGQEALSALNAYRRDVAIKKIAKEQNLSQSQDILPHVKAWWMKQERLDSAGFKRLGEIEQFRKKGGTFAEAALRFSDDPATKQFGGDAGFIKVDDMLPELRMSLAEAKQGEEKIVGSRHGLHLVQIKEGVIDEQSQVKRIHVFDITIMDQGGFEAWLNKEADNLETKVFIK